MALAYVGIFNIFGSYFWGMMGDTVTIFGAAIGFFWLGTVPLTSGLVRQIFGAHYMSTLYGVVFFTHQVGSFLGAWVGGLIYDYYGSYEPIWWSTVAMALFAVLLHLPIHDRPVPRLTVATGT